MGDRVAFSLLGSVNQILEIFGVGDGWNLSRF